MMRRGPATQPTRHPIMRYSFDTDPTVIGPVGQPAHARGMDVRAAIEQDALHRGVVEEPDAALFTHPRDLLPVLAGHDRTRRNGGVHEEDDPRAFAHGVAEALKVECPAPPLHHEGDETRHPTRETDALEHSRIGGVGHHHLVAGFDQREQRVQHPLRAAGGDDGLRVRVVGDAAHPADVAGRGRAEVVQAEEGEVAVGVGTADGCPRGPRWPHGAGVCPCRDSRGEGPAGRSPRRGQLCRWRSPRCRRGG